ncbi:MAG: DUF2760 domain-containing protein [Planctomycetales bacterium]|nr:DUF2760 domain-containing protein [Planctomycetales bacterium]
MRLFLAIRAFFATLFSGATADRVRVALSGPESEGARPAVPAPEPQAAASAAPASKAKPVGGRSDALTLLAALQREARLVDIVQEPLDSFSDQQIGAAARDVLRNVAQVLERMFGLQPLASAEEGSDWDATEEDIAAGRVRLTGQVSGSPPYRGSLVHPGWLASRCEIPIWNGKGDAAKVVSPVEVELR